MFNQKGVVHLLLPVLIVLIVAALAVYFIFFNKSFTIPGLSNLGKQEPKIAVKSEYKNPFKKENQYVNPFDEYKSPFLKFEK